MAMGDDGPDPAPPVAAAGAPAPPAAGRSWNPLLRVSPYMAAADAGGCQRRDGG